MRETEKKTEVGWMYKKKYLPVLGEITAPDLVTGSQCADVTTYKRSQAPLISNSLTMAARGSPRSGQVGRQTDIIRWAIVFGWDCGEPGH